MWFNVGWSARTKSSSMGSPNLSRMSAMISACFTVSMPNSPSRSWSSSMKSAGYPVVNHDRNNGGGHLGVVNGCAAADADGVAADAAGAGALTWNPRHPQLASQVLRGQALALHCGHALDVVNHVIERRIVCEDEIFVHGQTKLLRISAMISACFTVSMPNSPSRSWSSSTKSAG